MPIEAVERETETRFKALFEDVEGIPVDYGQPGFKRPSTAWCRFSLLGGLDVSVEIDGTSYDTSGIISIQIFTPESEPRRLSAQIYDKVAAVFRDQFFNGVHTLSPSRTVVGLDDGWWQVNCATEWEITEIN